jgi:hypothetical protein
VKQAKPRKKAPAGKTVAKKTTKTSTTKKAEAPDDKKQEACDLIVATYEALLQERGEEGRIWGSMIKRALQRRKPGFTESYYGFRSFSELLEEAEKCGLVKLQRDDKSGNFIVSA